VWSIAGDLVLLSLLLGLGLKALMLSSAQEIYVKGETFCRARVKFGSKTMRVSEADFHSE
jgi:hypothetical protein